MTTKYEPGTVAIATVSGRPNVRVFRTGVPSNMGWEFNRPDGDGHAWHSDLSRSVTDIRPLVVLDLDDIGMSVSDLTLDLRGIGSVAGEIVADQIESQTKPPRIPEPGLWGVVEAAYEGTRRKLVRMVTGVSDEQWCDDEGTWFDWAELVDPALIRPGIEDAS